MKQLIGMAIMIAVALAFTTSAAYAADGSTDGAVKIGILTDMTGVYASTTGKGSVTAAQMAIHDFGGKVLGRPIELISANDQDSPDIGSTIARKWIDTEHVDMIAGMIPSSVGLAVQHLASSMHVITINTDDAATAFSGQQCTKYGMDWTYSTHAQAVGTVHAMVKNGSKKWFMIAANYAYGHSLVKYTKGVLDSLGGKMLGVVYSPLGTTNFGSYLVQAQSSGAQVIALGMAGQDFVNALKQTRDFGIVREGQRLAAFAVYVTDVHALGLKTAQGLEFTVAFYWDRNQASRKWSERFFKKMNAMPTEVQAAMYSAVSTYLKAVKAAGTDNSDAVRAELGKMKIHDFFARDGHIQPDGRMVHNMYLVRVKKPSESHGAWDLLHVLRTIPGDVAFIPTSESACKLPSE